MLPRTLKCSTDIAGRPRGASFTPRRCVFIAMSTPVCALECVSMCMCAQACGYGCTGHAGRAALVAVVPAPVIVPCSVVPFLSSICTVSFVSFIRNLRCRVKSAVASHESTSKVPPKEPGRAAASSKAAAPREVRAGATHSARNGPTPDKLDHFDNCWWLRQASRPSLRVGS
jgi:hypothetical protein